MLTSITDAVDTSRSRTYRYDALIPKLRKKLMAGNQTLNAVCSQCLF